MLLCAGLVGCGLCVFDAVAVAESQKSTSGPDAKVGSVELTLISHHDQLTGRMITLVLCCLTGMGTCEVVVDYSLRLKQELGSDRTWVAGYSNDVLAYIPSRRVLLEGGYEGGGAMLYFGRPGPWAEGIERTIVTEVHRQVGMKTHGE